MSRPLALLRPEPGWSASAVAARALGLTVAGHPLFAAEPAAWDMPDGDFDGLLAGSAAIFRHAGPRLASLRHLPVHAVGAATAAAATEADFTVARTGEGGLQRLLDAAAADDADAAPAGVHAGARRYLRLGGEERVPLAPHPGQDIVERVVYRMRPLPVDPALAALLARGAPVTALHSAAAARHFAAEVDRVGLERGRLFLLVLGPRIAKAAGLGWAAVHLADRPGDAALLAKAAALCK